MPIGVSISQASPFMKRLSRLRKMDSPNVMQRQISASLNINTEIMVNATVTLPMVLSAPQITVDETNFTFQLSYPTGTNYVLESSTNLTDWNSVSTSSIPISGSISLTNAISGYNRRFYRVYL